ncbi:nucleophile aminohydrolase [Fimicolochytrium jonesii]|uniref:nucleophile aminohydrolase n=1 Tax=Fimicolochytrium jonesii TaxID=1396493 RepID=UPI0022FF3D76|nr:nucleophile aminohydrolase [Fimicolochytrium jonesii]KAI8819653.1 nucleophile aminohydrolase [Fimicolochytrium jonesii]
MDPTTRTQQPSVTGTSVLGIKFKDGIMLAADTLASYGSMARFRDVERLIKAGNTTIIGASGDISDFQYITHLLEKILIKEANTDDGHQLYARHIHEYLSRLMYGRRSKQNPLWNSLVIGGHRDKDGGFFLGFVDLQGTTYESPTIATGYGAYIAQPLLRNAIEKVGGEQNLTEQDAEKVLDDCMRVLFYRDARSLNKIQRATITNAGITITDPYELETEWAFAEGIRGYGATD